jgi:hypothetical protein
VARLEHEIVTAPDLAEDGDVTLLVPEVDVAEPELSIVVPALNEELTVGEFVDWCKLGLAQAGIAGEVLIVDSSQDRTTEIALEHGARVLKTPKRGLGRAYIDALPTYGAATCSWETPIARTTSGGWRRSSSASTKASSS